MRVASNPSMASKRQYCSTIGSSTSTSVGAAGRMLMASVAGSVSVEIFIAAILSDTERLAELGSVR